MVGFEYSQTFHLNTYHNVILVFRQFIPGFSTVSDEHRSNQNCIVRSDVNNICSTLSPHCLHTVTSETTRNVLTEICMIMFQCSCLPDNVHPRVGGEQTASLMLAWRGSNSPTLNHPGTRTKMNKASFVIKTFQIIISVSSAETEMLCFHKQYKV